MHSYARVPPLASGKWKIPSYTNASGDVELRIWFAFPLNLPKRSSSFTIFFSHYFNMVIN